MLSATSIRGLFLVLIFGLVRADVHSCSSRSLPVDDEVSLLQTSRHDFARKVDSASGQAVDAARLANTLDSNVASQSAAREVPPVTGSPPGKPAAEPCADGTTEVQDDYQKILVKTEDDIKKMLTKRSHYEDLLSDAFSKKAALNATIMENVMKGYQQELADSKSLLEYMLAHEKQDIRKAALGAKLEAQGKVLSKYARDTASKISKGIRDSVELSAVRDIQFTTGDVVQVLQRNSAELMQRSALVNSLYQDILRKSMWLRFEQLKAKNSSELIKSDKSLERQLAWYAKVLKWKAKLHETWMNTTYAHAQKKETEYEASLKDWQAEKLEHIKKLRELQVLQWNTSIQLDQLADKSINLVSSMNQQAEAHLMRLASEAARLPVPPKNGLHICVEPPCPEMNGPAGKWPPGFTTDPGLEAYVDEEKFDGAPVKREIDVGTN